LALACDDILPAGLVASVLNRTTVTTDLMVRPQSATPLGYAVSQVGGVSCLASGDATAQSSVSVQVLPEARTQWATYADKTADVVSGAASTYGDASHVSCLGRGAESACWVNILVDESWIEIIARGIDVNPSLSNDAIGDHVAPLIDDIVSAVRNAPDPEELWVAPASTGILPADCSVYATADEFRSEFGTAEEILINDGSDGDGWGIDNAAWTIIGGDRCMWVPESTGQTWPLYITALPGGEWGYDRSTVVMTADGTVQAVSVVGADRATFGCHVYSGFCTLDTVIAGNWIQLSAEQALIGAAGDVQALLIGIVERAVPRFSA
jgi:hypothetical protein